MITRRTIRNKNVPLPKGTDVSTLPSGVYRVELPVKVLQPTESITITYNVTELKPHQLRKRELSNLHGITEKDIFVDPKNGVELFRSITGGWVTNPAYRGVE